MPFSILPLVNGRTYKKRKGRAEHTRLHVELRKDVFERSWCVPANQARSCKVWLGVSPMGKQGLGDSLRVSTINLSRSFSVLRGHAR